MNANFKQLVETIVSIHHSCSPTHRTHVFAFHSLLISMYCSYLAFNATNKFKPRVFNKFKRWINMRSQRSHTDTDTRCLENLSLVSRFTLQYHVYIMKRRYMSKVSPYFIAFCTCSYAFVLMKGKRQNRKTKWTGLVPSRLADCMNVDRTNGKKYNQQREIVREGKKIFCRKSIIRAKEFMWVCNIHACDKSNFRKFLFTFQFSWEQRLAGSAPTTF